MSNNNILIAKELADISNKNKNKQDKVQLLNKGEVVLVNTRENVESYLNDLIEGIDIDSFTIIDFDYTTFNDKVVEGSHKYANFVIKECTELALRGFGCVKVSMDKTTDIYNIDEGFNSCYSVDIIKNILKDKGFIWRNYPADEFYTYTDTLIWNKDLPKAPTIHNIGKYWK